MTDPEALSTTDRWWWPYSGSISVVAARGIITAPGGWTVVLLAVDGIAKELPGGGNCLHYNARLVARCDSVIDQQIRAIDPTHPFTAHAMTARQAGARWRRRNDHTPSTGDAA
jgi:hypothetical protein